MLNRIDSICNPHGGLAVGNQHHRLALPFFVEIFKMTASFRLSRLLVGSSSKEGRVVQESSCQSQPLPLPAG